MIHPNTKLEIIEYYLVMPYYVSFKTVLENINKDNNLFKLKQKLAIFEQFLQVKFNLI